jgi:ubiquinone biosynthesis protein
VHWQWTCESLNVQDFVDGIPGPTGGVDAAGLDRRELARRGADIVLKMVLEDGSFHADPHPATSFYLRDGRIGVIDFGMVGALSEVRRFQVAQLLHGLVEQDPQGWPTCCWTGPAAWKWTKPVAARHQPVVDQYRGVPLKDLRIGLMLGDITCCCAAQPDPAGRSGADDQGLPDPGRHGPAAGPDFDMASAARPFLERVVLQRYAPALLKRGRRSLAGPGRFRR